MQTSAISLANQLRKGKLDPVDLAEQVLERIANCDDPAIFTETTQQRALSEAKAARKRLKAGKPASALDGVPLAWKDLFDLKGRVTTAGSVVLRGNAPASQDASLVTAAKAAGLVTVGCLNMTEFAYSGIGFNPHFGTPRNPHGPSAHDGGPARIPGGSSSACGVVVARGLVPISIGTDTGGSIRIPASFNGVVGYKPSTGHFPMDGVFPLARSFDVLGPLAQSVADCVVVDAVLQGRTRPKPRRIPLTTLQILVPETLVFDSCDTAVRANFEAAIERLALAGAQVWRAPMPQLQDIFDLTARRGSIASAEALMLHWDRVHGPDAARMDPRVVRRIRMAQPMTAVDLLEIIPARARLIAETNALIGEALVAFPTTPHTALPLAPLVDDIEAFFRANAKTLRNTMLGNFLDWCGLSIPSGFDGDGMPTGFLLSAPHGRDTALLSAGLSAEHLIRGQT